MNGRKIIILLFMLVVVLWLAVAVQASDVGPRTQAPDQSNVVTALTVQTLFFTGTTPSFAAAAAGGNSFANSSGDVFIEIKNVGSAINVTVTVASNVVDGLTIADLSATIPATTGDKMLGPFNIGRFNDGSGNVNIAFSSVTSVTIGAFRLPRG